MLTPPLTPDVFAGPKIPEIISRTICVGPPGNIKLTNKFEAKKKNKLNVNCLINLIFISKNNGTSKAATYGFIDKLKVRYNAIFQFMDLLSFSNMRISYINNATTDWVNKTKFPRSSAIKRGKEKIEVEKRKIRIE